MARSTITAPFPPGSGNVSFINEGMTNDADGKILARGKGSEIDFANAILTNIGIIAATHHGEVRLTDVTPQNGINGVIAADDGGKIWITDLQHGSTNYGLVEAFDGGKITIVGYNNNGGGSGGSGHNGNFGNIDAIGCSSASISKATMAAVSTIKTAARLRRLRAARSCSVAM